MAKTPKLLYESQDIDIASIAKSLGHPARVKILKILLRKSPQNCAEIVEQIPLAQATVSQHLSELKHSGLITDRKVANKVMYSADKARISMANSLLSDLFIGHQKNIKQQKLF